MTVKTIDITPTWTALVPVFVELLQHEQTKQAAIDELYKMAKGADLYIEFLKELNNESV